MKRKLSIVREALGDLADLQGVNDPSCDDDPEQVERRARWAIVNKAMDDIEASVDNPWPAKMMVQPKLGQRLYDHIARGAKIMGTLQPSEIMYVFEEELTPLECDLVQGFLQWCHDNGKKFGHGNYEARFLEYLQS